MSVAEAILLSRKTLAKIRQNLFWAFFYNAVGIPFAALGMLSPIIAGAAMSFSSVSVVSNSLSLKRFQPKVPGKEKRGDHANRPVSIQQEQELLHADEPTGCKEEAVEKEEETRMQKTIDVQGMTCNHCKTTVENAVKALPGVSKAEVSLEAGSVDVSFDADQTTVDRIKAAIREAGYEPA